MQFIAKSIVPPLTEALPSVTSKQGASAAFSVLMFVPPGSSGGVLFHASTDVSADQTPSGVLAVHITIAPNTCSVDRVAGGYRKYLCANNLKARAGLGSLVSSTINGTS